MLYKYSSQKHLFHLVDESPWPFITSMSTLTLTIGGVMYMHSIQNGLFVMTLGIVNLLSTMAIWWRDVIREATFEGHHTSVVQIGLRYGMILFILSEVMFFFAFFWAFFHSSLAPTIEIGSLWPPVGIDAFKPFQVPFLNTLILLSSGATITWAHHAIVSGSRLQSIAGIFFTVILAVTFTLFQVYEYIEANFRISDGVYGTTFYLATGFHGFHVIIGTIFIIVCGFRHVAHHFTTTHHFGFEAAAWYWHFVDVVWLFLFVSIYWWGGSH